MQAYNYENNRLFFETKTGLVFDLSLRGNITVIRGESGTGKTLLVKSLEGIAGVGSVNYLGNVDVSNIITVAKKTDFFDFDDVDKLVIVDRADLILSDTIVEHIRQYKKLRFLIFARASYDFFISPNQLGIFVRDKNTISIKYDFDKKGWF